MTTPTQIATQSMKGCGESVKTAIYDFECGDYLNEELILCPSCKSEILAHKMDWENELEFLKKIIFCPKHYCITYKQTHKDKKERISELTSALKILETK